MFRKITIILILISVILIFGTCSKDTISLTPTIKYPNVTSLLSAITDSYSYIYFDKIQTNINISFDEYEKETLIHSEELGTFELNINKTINSPYILITVTHNIEQGQLYYTFIYSNKNSTIKKSITRSIPIEINATYKGICKSFENKIEENNYILSITALSKSKTNIGHISDDLSNLNEYDITHIFKMTTYE